MALQYWTNQNLFPFVITYNPALRSMSSIIRKQFHILISLPRCYNVFKAAPIVAYSRSSNLSDFLVRAKRRNLTQPNQPRSLYPCGKTDLLANTDLTDKLHTHPTLPITHHIDCNSKNVIYVAQCNHCFKQYIGETKRRLKDRFNEHRRLIDIVCETLKKEGHASRNIGNKKNLFPYVKSALLLLFNISSYS